MENGFAERWEEEFKPAPAGYETVLNGPVPIGVVKLASEPWARMSIARQVITGAAPAHIVEKKKGGQQAAVYLEYIPVVACECIRSRDGIIRYHSDSVVWQARSLTLRW